MFEIILILARDIKRNQYKERSTNDVKSFQFRGLLNVASRVQLRNWSSVQAVVYKTHFPYVVCTINWGKSYEVETVCSRCFST